MKKTVFSLLPLVLAFAVLGVAAYPVAAANTTILPMSAFTLTYNNLSEGDTITGDWSAGGTLSFVLTGPGSSSLATYTGTSGIVFHLCMDDGDYVLSWANLGLSASIALEYDITATGGGDMFEDFGTAVLIGLLVFVAVIVIVIVIVVLVVLRGKKSRKASPQPVIAPPMGGNCSVCGMPVDPQLSFCSKCGAKLR